jgi:hypothetical protein
MIPQARPKKPFTKPLYPVTPKADETQEQADSRAVEDRKYWYNHQQLSAGNNPVHFYKDATGSYALVYGPKCKDLKRLRPSVALYFRLLAQIPGSHVWQDSKDGQLLARLPVSEADFAAIPLYPIEGY